jgi:polyhydroxybutyrate depolymerase
MANDYEGKVKDNDETIAYAGGSFAPGFAYPGAEETAALWAARNACDDESVPGGILDLETYTGSETSLERWQDCEPGGAAELWTVNGGTHVPRGGAEYLDLILAFLLEHAR